LSAVDVVVAEEAKRDGYAGMGAGLGDGAVNIYDRFVQGKPVAFREDLP